MKITEFLEKRNNNLDLFRIIMASLVIFGHSPALNGPPSDFWLDPISELFKFTYSGALAVKIFFFISGLVVTNSLLKNPSVIRFAISRVARLIPGLFFVLIISALVIGPFVTNLDPKKYFSAVEIYRYVVSNLLFVKATNSLPGVFINNAYPNSINGSLWSLYYEVSCYLMLIFLFLVLGSNKKILNMIALAVIFEAMLPNRILLGWISTNTQINLLPFSFFIGVFFAINAEHIEFNKKTMIGSWIILFFFKDAPIGEMVLILSLSITIIVLSSSKNILRIRIKYDISYGVYLWGFVVQQTVFYFFGHMYVGFHFMLSLFISVIMGYISYLFIEFPSIKMGQKIYRFTIKNQSLMVKY